MKTEPQPVTPFERLRELEAKATPGPWEALSDGISEMHNETHSLHSRNGSLVSYGHLTKSDAALIVESRNALPALLNSHAELLAALKELLRHADKDSPACDCEYIAAREAASLAIHNAKGKAQP